MRGRLNSQANTRSPERRLRSDGRAFGKRSPGLRRIKNPTRDTLKGRSFGKRAATGLDVKSRKKRCRAVGCAESAAWFA